RAGSGMVTSSRVVVRAIFGPGSPASGAQTKVLTSPSRPSTPNGVVCDTPTTPPSGPVSVGRSPNSTSPTSAPTSERHEYDISGPVKPSKTWTAYVAAPSEVGS